ncbi:hypothetical protein V4Y02_23805, partial [Escherichia coli]
KRETHNKQNVLSAFKMDVVKNQVLRALPCPSCPLSKLINFYLLTIAQGLGISSLFISILLDKK